MNKTSLQHFQPQLTLATHLALLITQLPVMTCIKLSYPASLDICLTPSSMLHHCIYFLIGVTRIYYSSCTRWLLVLISRAPARGHPRGGGQRFPGGTSHLGYTVPRSTYRQRTRTSAVLSGDAALAIPERAEPVATTPAPVAVATDPSGCRAPTAGCSCMGRGHVFPGLAGGFRAPAPTGNPVALLL